MIAINPADDEINILLPLFIGAFAIAIIVFGLICFGILRKFVITKPNSQGVVKDALLSLIGVFIFAVILGVILFFVNLINKVFVSNV